LSILRLGTRGHAHRRISTVGTPAPLLGWARCHSSVVPGVSQTGGRNPTARRGPRPSGCGLASLSASRAVIERRASLRAHRTPRNAWAGDRNRRRPGSDRDEMEPSRPLPGPEESVSAGPGEGQRNSYRYACGHPVCQACPARSGSTAPRRRRACNTVIVSRLVRIVQRIRRPHKPQESTSQGASFALASHRAAPMTAPKGKLTVVSASSNC
jgi:hypothetical protein